ncbi:MAG TPA: hypothetical protein VFG30_13255 [Polyangiales bacterium]|nr:hypothetical protein [Polyangiales bacterium]
MPEPALDPAPEGMPLPAAAGVPLPPGLTVAPAAPGVAPDAAP